MDQSQEEDCHWDMALSEEQRGGQDDRETAVASELAASELAAASFAGSAFSIPPESGELKLDRGGDFRVLEGGVSLSIEEGRPSKNGKNRRVRERERETRYL